MTIPEHIREEAEARDIYEVANQLGGYVDRTTEPRLAAFLLREADAAAKLADEIVQLRAALIATEQRGMERAAEGAREAFDAGYSARDRRTHDTFLDALEDYEDRQRSAIRKARDGTGMTPKAGEIWADRAGREIGPLEIVEIAGHRVIRADLYHTTRYWTPDGVHVDFEHYPSGDLVRLVRKADAELNELRQIWTDIRKALKERG